MEPSQTPVQNSVSAASNLAIPVAIVIAGALIAGGLFFGMSRTSAPDTQKAPPAKAVNIKDVHITDSDPFIGQANAPVTMVAWEDYQCPFCKAVEVGGIPQIPIKPSFPSLIKDYVDTGKLKIVFKDYPFLGEDSITAALYEHAIWDTYPDKFYTWRTAMFKAQDAEGDQGFGDEPSILALIKKIPGMNADTLKALVVKNKDAYTKLINDDQAEGSSFGIQGTPGFITGTQSIDGAVEYTVFKAAIDKQLK